MAAVGTFFPFSIHLGHCMSPCSITVVVVLLLHVGNVSSETFTSVHRLSEKETVI